MVLPAHAGMIPVDMRVRYMIVDCSRRMRG